MARLHGSIALAAALTLSTTGALLADEIIATQPEAVVNDTPVPLGSPVATSAPGPLGRPATLPVGPYDPRLLMRTPRLRPHACGSDYSVPKRRGVAILSPIESPDHWDPPLGGHPQCVPYYPDYCKHSTHGQRIGIPGNGLGYNGPRGATSSTVGAAAPEAAAPTGADFGGYSGASQDEAALLRLGGQSGIDRAGRAPDLIDRIQTGQ